MIRFKSLSFAALLIVLSLSLGTVHATTNPQHYGPYPSGSTDSGTCGNNWADDTFDRHFAVFSNGGMFTIYEGFLGSFLTPSKGDVSTGDLPSPQPNPSPGACQTPPPSTGLGGTVNNGVTGNMYGYFKIFVPPGTTQTSTSSKCDVVGNTNNNCTTGKFVNTHFSCHYPGTCFVSTFFFKYHADDQCLIEHTWQNASPDVGGNKGDIRSGTGPCVCHESDGNGDFQGTNGKGNFNIDNDGCMDGDQNQISSTNRGDGKDFRSTQIDTTTFDSVAHKLTITGVGVSGGVPVSFVFVALETGPTTPGWVSFAFSDGYTNAGTLVNGSILLH
jgi:hypothetical protein